MRLLLHRGGAGIDCSLRSVTSGGASSFGGSAGVASSSTGGLGSVASGGSGVAHGASSAPCGSASGVTRRSSRITGSRRCIASCTGSGRGSSGGVSHCTRGRSGCRVGRGRGHNRRYFLLSAGSNNERCNSGAKNELRLHFLIPQKETGVSENRSNNLASLSGDFLRAALPDSN